MGFRRLSVASALAPFILLLQLGAAPALAATAVSKEFLLPASVNPGNLQSTAGQTADNTPSQGDVRTVRLGLSEVGNPLTGGSVTDNLPAPLVLAPTVNPRASPGCGGAVGFAGVPGGAAFQATGIAVPAGDNTTPGRCYLYFDVVSSQVTANVTNTIPAGGFVANETGVGAATNVDPASRNLGVLGLNPLTIAHGFTPGTIRMGETASFTIVVGNPNPGRSVGLLQVDEVLPANIVASATAPVVTCTAGGTAGSVTASGTSGAVTLTYAATVIAGAGSCTATWNVTGIAQDGTSISGTNAVPANGVRNDRGLAYTATTATIVVQSPVLLTKTFTPNPARAGEPVTVTLSLANRSAAPLTAVSFSDNPISNPAGLTISSIGPVSAIDCGGAATFGSTATALTFAGGTLASGATCTLTATVSGAGPASYVDTTSGATWTQGVNTFTTDPATQTLAVFSGLRAFKALLDPRTGAAISGGVAPGELVRVRVELENFSTGQLPGVSVTDPLPASGGAQITYANATVPGGRDPQTNCTATGTTTAPGPVAVPATTAVAGAITPSFTALVVPGNPGGNANPSSRCFVEFDALIPPAWPTGTQITNSIPQASIGNGSILAQNTVVANLATVNRLTIGKAFAPSTISAGSTALLTLTLTNTGFFDLTGTTVTDNLPAGAAGGQLIVATPAAATTTCAGTPVYAINAGRDTFQASGLTVPARTAGQPGGSCVVTLRVLAGVATTFANTIPIVNVAAVDARTGVPVAPVAPASATLTATPSLTATKSFTPATVSATGGTSRVTIVLGNIGSSTLTGVGVTDPLPPSLRVRSPSNVATTCAGAPTLAAVAGSGSAVLAGAALAAGTTCTFQFDVVTNGAPNPVVNTIPPGNVIAAGNVISTTSTTASLATFTGGGLTLQKSFNPTDLQTLGQPTRMTVTLSNLSTQALTGLGFADALPAGMLVSAVPDASTTCAGGQVDAAAGGVTVALRDGRLAAGNGSFPAPAGAACTVTVDVTLNRSGTANNTIAAGAVGNDQGVTNGVPVVANVTALATVGVAKRFVPAAVLPNAPAQLVISVIDAVGIDFMRLTVVDPLPAGLVLATPAGASTTCSGGSVTTRPSTLGGGRTDVVLQGATLTGVPGGTSSCEISVYVQAAAIGSYANAIPIGNVTADGGVTNSGAANATLNVRAAVTVAKAFANASRRVNQANALTITLTNPNSVALTNLALTDALPAGVFVATTPNASTTCTGGTVAADPSATFVRLTQATLPAGASCLVLVDVLANVPGTWTNRIADGAVVTAEGVTNAVPASATFVTLDPPTVGKEFRPVQIAAGGTAKLRIVLGNTNASAVTLTQALTDTLPAGVVLAAPAIDAATADPQGLPRCPGVATATVGGSTIAYPNAATIPAGGCVIFATVTGATLGQFTNVVAAGALQTDAGTNASPASAVLSISARNSVSGKVYLDPGNDGVAGAADPPLPGQTVELLNGGGIVLATTVTDTLGNYAFVDLADGTYTVREPTQPGGTLNGITTVGTGVPPGNAGTATARTTVPSAISGIVLAGAQNVIDADFGELAPASISGVVFLDRDNNGTRQFTDAPLGGVTVTLSGSDDLGAIAPVTTTTGADGTWSFTNLRPGTYAVTEPIQPTGTANGITTAGTVGGVSIGTATAVATTPSALTAIVLGAGRSVIDARFAEVASASISGTVYVDRNGDNRFDPGDVDRVAGVTIQLVQGASCAAGTVLQTTTTDTAGRYAFASVAAGASYLVCETVPPVVFNAGNAGGTPGGTSVAITNLPSGGLGGVDFGLLALNNSPILVATKEPVGAFVSGNLATYRITVANIGAIPTGAVAYTVQDRLPAGLALAAPPAGTDWQCTGAVGAAAFGCTATTALAGGATNPNPITVRVQVAPAVTRGANAIVLDNALLVDGGGEAAFFTPTPTDRARFNANPAALPVCAPVAAIRQNVCRTPTTVVLGASVAGTVWYDSGAAPRQLDGGDRRLAGWTVEVLDGDAAGAPIVLRVTTGSDGSWRADDLQPGKAYLIRFRDPVGGQVWGIPVSGESGIAPVPCLPSNPGNAGRSACVEVGSAAQLRIVLQSGDNLLQQSLPVDPSGVVYDAATRQPVPGAVVTLTPDGACAGWDPALDIVNATLGGYTISGGSIAATTGADGAYQFLFNGNAPASCPFTLSVAPGPAYVFPATLAPAGVAPALAGPGTIVVQPQAGPPTGAQSTTYFLTFTGGSQVQGLVHNQIPVDPRDLTGVNVLKSGSVRRIELGDTMQYAIRVQNVLAVARTALFVHDRLPAGFRYLKGTARVERNGASVPLADPTSLAGAPGASGPDLVFAVGTLAGNAALTLTYRVRAGVGAAQGDGINHAWAAARADIDCRTGTALCSNESRWKVAIDLGVFTNEACFAGKVFVDCNHNHVQDVEELGIPGVRLYLQDGTFLISDSEGKYSFCGLPARTHVLKVDPLTLPRGSRLTTSSNRNAGDANSLFLDLKNGALQRADFIEGSCSNTVLEQVKARRAQGEGAAPQTERRGGEPLRLRGKAPDAPGQATDGADQQPVVGPRRPAPPAPRGPEGTPPRLPSAPENNQPTGTLPMNTPRPGGPRGDDAR